MTTVVQRDVLAELDAAAHARMVERSLRQMRRAGRRYAFLPFRLGEAHPGWIDAMPGPGRDWSELVGCARLTECWQADLEPNVIEDFGGHFLCLLELGHEGDCGWPDEAGRAQIVRAFAEQVDPVRRVERRLMAIADELGLPAA